MSIVTCHTDGCANSDIRIEMTLTYVDPETEETKPVDAVYCGECKEPITDIEGAPDA
jgi:hypothetical protein